jgi:hypothetical protein
VKRGLIFSLYSPKRDKLHKELEKSIDSDLVNFDLLKLPMAQQRRFMAPDNAAGYDYARDNGYEFVTRIDDDDLIVPGALTLFMSILDENPSLSGCGGEQVQFYGNPPVYTLPQNPRVSYDKRNHLFHGVTLHRTDRVYPIVDQWRTEEGYDIHRSLIRKMMHDKHTFGYVESPTSYWRRRYNDKNY